MGERKVSVKREAPPAAEPTRTMVVAIVRTDLLIGLLEYCSKFVEDLPCWTRPYDAAVLSDEERASLGEFDRSRAVAGLRFEGMWKSRTGIIIGSLAATSAVKWRVYRVVADRDPKRRHPWTRVEGEAAPDQCDPFPTTIKPAAWLPYLKQMKANRADRVEIRFVEGADKTFLAVAGDIDALSTLVQNFQHEEDQPLGEQIRAEWRLRVLFTPSMCKIFKFFSACAAASEAETRFAFSGDGPEETKMLVSALRKVKGIETTPQRCYALRQPGLKEEEKPKKKSKPKATKVESDTDGEVADERAAMGADGEREADVLARGDSQPRVDEKNGLSFSSLYIKSAFEVPACTERVEVSFGNQMPLFLSVLLDESGGCNAKLLVAPRIEMSSEL